MKSDPSKLLISKLNRVKEELEFITQPESKARFQKNLDDLIKLLSRLREGLLSPSLEARAAEIHRPLGQVISFLEFAKYDEALKMLLSSQNKAKPVKPKRPAIEIGNNLTNEQIRSLLQEDLSKAELKAIATQRAISIGKLSNKEIRQNILRNLERQEGYQRLAS
jgi:hypothetical protein